MNHGDHNLYKLHKLGCESGQSSASSCAVRQARHSQNVWVRHVKRVVSRRDEPSGILSILAYCVLAELGLTLAGSKVKGDELSRDGPHRFCVNLYLFCTYRLSLGV